MNGCDNDVAVITYKQIGLCHSYLDSTVPDPTTHATAPPTYYVEFQIDAVDTSGSKVDFKFDPSLLVVNGGVGVSKVDVWLTTNLAGPFATLPSATFPAGQAPPSAPSSFVVAAIVTAGPSSNLDFSLTYESPDPKNLPLPLTVLTVKDAPTPTPPNEQDNCADIHLMS
jgi:hypothetical protein